MPDGIPSLLNDVRFVASDSLQSQSSLADLDQIRFIPWAQDESAHDFAVRTLSRNPCLAPVKAVRTVNSRRFSAPFDLVDPDSTMLPFGKTVGRCVESVAELEQSLSAIRDAGWAGWIIKQAWSNAGRNRVTGTAIRLTNAQRSWAEKTLRRHSYVCVEPWLAVERECGLQFEIDQTLEGDRDAIRFAGCAELLTDARGGYRGSLISEEVDPLWKPAIDHGRTVCAAAADAGYFGPIGIDCMAVEHPGGFRMLRLCHDVNARCTMGRLALALRNRLNSGEQGVWWHLNAANSVHDEWWLDFCSTPNGANAVRIERTSPELTGGRPVRNQSQLIVLTTPVETSTLAGHLRRRLLCGKKRE